MIKIIKEHPLEIVVDKDVLSERLNVDFYHPNFAVIDKTLSSVPWEVKTIGEIAKKITKGETPLWRGDKYVEEGIPFLRVTNLREEGIDTANLVYISEETNRRMKRSQLKNNDILYSMAGTIGIAILFSNKEHFKEANINQAIAKIELKENYNSLYVSIFLNTKLGKLQAERFICAIAQPNINFKQIKSIKVVLPSKEAQKKVIKIMNDAWREKKEKLEKSSLLVYEINKFILNQLNIKIPRVERAKTYSINLENDFKSRLDPMFFQPKYIHFFEAIQNSPYEVKDLREISKIIVSGQRPKGGVKYIQDGILSIGGEHITAEGDFIFYNPRYIPKEFHKKQKKSWIKPYDILIVKDGATTGKVAIISDDFPFKESNINEHVFRVEARKENNPYYIFSYLFSDLGQTQINRLISGAAQKGITRKAIESIKIITPSIKLQNRIANEVKRRKEVSKKLKNEADEVVKNAKKEAENLIFGRYF